MKLRVLGTLTVLTLFLVLVQVSADPPDKPSPTDPKTPTDVSSVDIGVRVLATLKDSEQKEHSRDLAKYAKDPSAVDDVLLFKATAKTPMSRYRLHHLDLQSGGRCYYGIDLYAKGDARLLEMTGGAGDAAWKKPARDGSPETVFTAALEDVEVWTRVIAGQTEVLARCARENVALEVLVRNKDKDAAAKEVRERFQLFYQNAQANQLFGDRNDYWKWFVQFSELCELNNDEIAVIVVTLAERAKERRTLLATFQHSLQTENEAFPKDGNFFYEWAALMKNNGDDKSLPPLSPKLSLAKMKAQRDKISTKYIALHDEQATLIGEAERDMQTIVRSIEQVWQLAQKDPKFTTEEGKKHLEMSYHYWKDQQALLKMRLYDAAGWYKPEELPKVIEELHLSTDADAEVARLMKVKLLLGSAEDMERRIWLQRISPAYSPEAQKSQIEKDAQKARLDAIGLLHEILKANPQHREARATLLQQEFLVLNWIAGKMERERRASWAAFQKFFTNRGYDSKSPDGLCDVFKETAWVIWNNPWSTAGHYIAGTPDGLADAVSIDEESAAANLVSMNVLKRLCRRGLLLQEVRALKPEELKKHMLLTIKAKDQPDKLIDMPDEKVKSLRSDVMSAFNDTALGLADLADGKGDTFLEKFNKTYYDVYDPERSWTEAIGDFCLSPSMLVFTVGPYLTPMMRLPASANKWGFVRQIPEGYKTIHELVSGGLNLPKLSNRLKDTTVGQWVAEDLAFIDKLDKADWILKLNKVELVGRVYVARGVAAVGLYAGLTELTEEYNLPKARLVVHCIFQLQGTQIVYGILAAAHVPPGPVTQAVEQLKKDASKEAEELANKAANVEEAEKLIGTLGKAANEAERTRITAAVGKNALVTEGTEIAQKAERTGTLQAVGINSAADLRWAMVNLAKAAAKGDAAEMNRIVGAVKSLLRRMKQTVDQRLEESIVALSILTKWQPKDRPVPTTTVKLMTEAIPERFFQAESVYEKSGGTALRAGDALMREGEFTAAEEAYTKGVHKANAPLIGDGELSKMLDEKRAMAALAQSEAKMKAAAQAAAKDAPDLPAKLARAITEEEQKALEQSGKLLVAKDDYTFFVEAEGKKYFFKIYRPGAAGVKSPEQFAETITDGCIASLLAKQLGLPASAARQARLKFLKTPGGKAIPEAAGILTRAFDGAELLEGTLGEALAYKAELAQMRVFRGLIADPDAHARNYLVNRKIGQLIGIDFENAHFANNNEHRLVVDIEKNVPVDTYLKTYILDFINLGNGDSKMYGAADRLDELLSYKDMEKFLEKIEEQFGGDKGKTTLGKLIKEGYQLSGKAAPEDKVVAAHIKVLQDRIEYLGALIRDKFPRTPKPRTSWREPRVRERMVA